MMNPTIKYGSGTWILNNRQTFYWPVLERKTSKDEVTLFQETVTGQKDVGDFHSLRLKMRKKWLIKDIMGSLKWYIERKDFLFWQCCNGCKNLMSSINCCGLRSSFNLIEWAFVVECHVSIGLSFRHSVIVVTVCEVVVHAIIKRGRAFQIHVCVNLKETK